MKELRKIIGRTQGEFAAMIGASKDAVASWETGRNKLSRQFARRIAFATGVEEGALVRGSGPLRCYVPLAGRQAFTEASSSNTGRAIGGDPSRPRPGSI